MDSAPQFLVGDLAVWIDDGHTQLVTISFVCKERSLHTNEVVYVIQLRPGKWEYGILESELTEVKRGVGN